MTTVLRVCLLVFGFVLNWGMVFAADLYVEPSGSCGGKTPCYFSIQEAVNAADTGDTIKIAEGIYAETFVLNSDKQLLLQGGWDVGFTTQTPKTTVIRAPIVIKGSITFQEVVIMEITWPFGNATTADVLDGKTFSNDTGTGLTGIMPNRGGLSFTPTTTDQSIAAGYYNGSGKVAGDADLASENIKMDVEIFDVVGSYPLAGVAKTGQTILYETGDDGDLKKGVAWPSPRFTDNTGGETGTVSDNLTGLMWAENANADGLKSWNRALTYCNELILGGYDDWRLPNVKELFSLIDFGQNSPALPTDHPFDNVQTLLSYWSSTTNHGNTFHAWEMSMSSGHVNSVGKDLPLYVWPVRGGNISTD